MTAMAEHHKSFLLGGFGLPLLSILFDACCQDPEVQSFFTRGRLSCTDLHLRLSPKTQNLPPLPDGAAQTVLALRL